MNWRVDVRRRRIAEWHEQNRQRVKALKENQEQIQEQAGVVKRGLLKIYEGNVYYGWSPLMIRRDGAAYVSAEIRASLKTGTQAIFDEILFETRSEGLKIKYEENLSKLFSVDSVMDAFSELSIEDARAFNEKNNTDLTEEEIGSHVNFKQAQQVFNDAQASFDTAKQVFEDAKNKKRSLAREVRKKIAAKFSPPKLPGSPEIGDIDLSIFGEEQSEVSKWLTDPGTPASYNLNSMTRHNPAKFNILRIYKTGKSVETLTGYCMPLSQARRIYTKVKKYEADPNNVPASFQSGDNTVVIYRHHLAVGCQTIPRSEVDRLGVMMGWDLDEPAKAATA